MASNLLNLDTTTLNSGSLTSANKSLYIGSYGGTPTVAIFGGTNTNILSNPIGNLDKLFFYSGFDYLRVRSAVNFTISLPQRATRASSGGKKGGSNLTSYNGYSDRYIYYHNYGTPTPAFSMYLNNDVSNGSYAGMALAGSVPIQYLSNNSFRMALVYSTDKYLVLRERYQVYQQTLPALTLKCTAYFYNNPTSVNAQSGLGIVHSPTTFNDVSPYGSPVRGRVYTNTATFTSTGGTTFNKVEVMRFGGGGPTSFGNPYQITTINGTAVTPYDPYNTWTTYTYGSQQTTWTMGIKVTDIPKTDAIGKNKYVYYTPRYAVKFTNTATGQTFSDSWGGVISFYVYL